MNNGNGLRRQWIDAIENTSGEFLLMVEQDFKILPNSPALSDPVALFNERRDIS